ncbi:CRP-like cAMP-binding protein [Flavobacterium sp. 2755]|uniref:Crp/Fnr family transcriptional regulator n=1 Tax=Flavobacterium sp. 2755 TaxID=2817765 RepID=UPI00285FCD02|nr:Crp/Fnr family transcriptional regulator [Flavobacterium sp. 2755]MDR6764427.1 CRP-like cAMP-binding protein [Flavobacterium sp. 2755]
MSISKIRQIKKDEFFISEGQVPKKFGIVINGLFRYYYISDKGDEFTKGLILKGNVLAAYSAMLHQQKSLFYIQALEDAVVLEIDYNLWLELQMQNSFWDKLLITLLQKGYCIKEKRERELLLLDAEARYKIFLEEFPTLEKQIKLQIIASYLGIKPESLSRIRKNISS